MRVSNAHMLAGVVLALMTVTVPSGQPAPLQPGEFVLAKPSNVVTWAMKRLAPPSPLYITTDDVMRATAASSQANEVVTVNYRLLRAFDQAVIAGQFQVRPGSNRVVAAIDNPVTEGFLISASCQAAVATTRGQTFVRLLLNPKALGSGQPAHMLMADYITTAMAPGYPNGRVLSPIEGPGLLYSVRAAHAPAGTNWLFTVPTNARWRVRTIQSLLTASAAVANRIPYLVISSPTDIIAIIPGNSTLTAGLSEFFVWADGCPFQGDAANHDLAPLPRDLTGLAGYTLAPQVLNIQAGDQWSDFAVAFVEEWLDNV